MYNFFERIYPLKLRFKALKVNKLIPMGTIFVVTRDKKTEEYPFNKRI